MVSLPNFLLPPTDLGATAARKTSPRAAPFPPTLRRRPLGPGRRGSGPVYERAADHGPTSPGPHRAPPAAAGRCGPRLGAAGGAGGAEGPAGGAAGAATGKLPERGAQPAERAAGGGGAGRRRGPGAAGASGSPSPASPFTPTLALASVPAARTSSAGEKGTVRSARRRPHSRGPLIWGWSDVGDGGAPDHCLLGEETQTERVAFFPAASGKARAGGGLPGAPPLSLCFGYLPRI